MCKKFILYVLALLAIENGNGKADDESGPITILVFGVSGSGKSAMVDAILNQTQINWALPSESGIVEYSIQASSKTEIRIVNIPDLQDVNEFETDARVLVTLDAYLDTHEILNKKVPDVLLICQDFDSTQPVDENSKFVKMLKSLFTMKSRLFRLTDGEDDSEVDNVIIGLLQQEPMTTKNSRRKLREIRHAITEYSIIPGDQVPMTIVKNEDAYIQNLCTEIIVMIQSVRPNLHRKDIKICNKYDLPKLLSNVTLVEISHPKAVKMLNKLVGISKKPAETEVGSALKAAYERLKCNDSSILEYLQTTFHNEEMFRIADLPQTDSELMSLYQKLKKDMIISQILSDGLDLTAPSFSPSIGNGYSLELDEMLPTSPLKFQPSENVSCMGNRLPVGVDCQKHELRTSQIMRYTTSMEDYINDRASALGIPKSAFVKIENLPNLKPGFTFPGALRNSIYAEFQLYEIQIQDFQLAEDFKAAINQLPKFDSANRVTVAAYEDFFDAYGTFIVSKIGYGGTIEFTLGDSWDVDTENPLKTIIDWIHNKNSKRTGDFISIEIHGGDPDLYATDPFVFFAEANGKSLFSKWKASLHEFPVGLRPTPLELTSLTTMLRSLVPAPERLQDLEAALTYFNGAEYKVDGVGKQLTEVLGVCNNELKDLKSSALKCEKNTENFQLQCNAEEEKCKPIREELKKLLSAKLDAQSKFNTVKSESSSKVIENAGLKLKYSEIESKIKQLEESLRVAREELVNEKAHSSKLQALLNNRG